MKISSASRGMSCGACVSNVKRALLQLQGVEDAEVRLHPQSVVLTIMEVIGVDESQAQLNKAGHYNMKEVVSI